MKFAEITESQRVSIESILEKPELVDALGRVCELEAASWHARLINEALNLANDPVTKVCRQAEYAGRALALESFLELLKRKVKR